MCLKWKLQLEYALNCFTEQTHTMEMMKVYKTVNHL